MTYRRDKKRNTKKLLVGGLLTLFLVYTVLFTRVFDVLSIGVGYVAVPVWKTQEYISGTWNNIRTTFVFKKDLLAENKRLREDMEIASAKLLDRNLLFEENIELKELLNRGVEEQTVFGVVLTKPSRSLYDTLIIDVGENAGVKKGDKVLYGGTIVIGEVVQVLPRSSKVLLISSPGESIDVVVGRDNIAAIAHGRGGGNFELKLPRDSDVVVGDVVRVPNITTRILGRVEYIETKPSDPFKTVLFSGPINIFKLKWVEVVINNTK